MKSIRNNNAKKEREFESTEYLRYSKVKNQKSFHTEKVL